MSFQPRPGLRYGAGVPSGLRTWRTLNCNCTFEPRMATEGHGITAQATATAFEHGRPRREAGPGRPSVHPTGTALFTIPVNAFLNAVVECCCLTLVSVPLFRAFRAFRVLLLLLLYPWPSVVPLLLLLLLSVASVAFRASPCRCSVAPAAFRGFCEPTPGISPRGRSTTKGLDQARASARGLAGAEARQSSHRSSGDSTASSESGRP